MEPQCRVTMVAMRSHLETNKNKTFDVVIADVDVNALAFPSPAPSFVSPPLFCSNAVVDDDDDCVIFVCCHNEEKTSSLNDE